MGQAKATEKLMSRYSKRVAAHMLKGEGALEKEFRTAELRVTKAATGWGWALYHRNKIVAISGSTLFKSKRAAEDAFCEMNMLTMAAMAHYDAPSATEFGDIAARLERTAKKTAKSERLRK